MRLFAALAVLGVAAACAVPTQAPPNPPAATPQNSAQPAVPPELAAAALVVTWRAEREVILPVEAETGRQLAGYAPVAASPVARAADGSRLAAVETVSPVCEAYARGSACRPAAAALRLLDVGSWAEQRVELPPGGWAGPGAFSPNAARLALAHTTRGGSSVLLIDAEHGAIMAKRALSFRPSLIAFGPDGASVVAYGEPLGDSPGLTQPLPPRLAVLAVPTLQTAWELAFDDLLSGGWCLERCEQEHAVMRLVNWSPAVVLAPDSSRLHIVHADQDRLTTVDLEARAVRDAPIEPAQAWLESLLALSAGTAHAKGPMEGAYKSAVLSADGCRLYVLSQTWHTVEATGEGWFFDWKVEETVRLQEVEAATGRLLAEREAGPGDLGLTPDGRFLMVREWGEPGTRLLQSDGLEDHSALEWLLGPAHRLDGQPLLLASRPNAKMTQMAVIEAAGFGVAHQWEMDGYADWLRLP